MQRVGYMIVASRNSPVMFRLFPCAHGPVLPGEYQRAMTISRKETISNADVVGGSHLPGRGSQAHCGHQDPFSSMLRYKITHSPHRSSQQVVKHFQTWDLFEQRLCDIPPSPQPLASTHPPQQGWLKIRSAILQV